ncbi:hypothetical protein LTR86_009899 [Recurvomyces mirabilis]|nr:hypothetical protein LTR86_009899 [Recurvomyces mirabilis]
MLSALFTAGPISAIRGSNSSSSSAKRSSSPNSQTTSGKSCEVSPSTASSSSHPSQLMTTTELAAQWLKGPQSPAGHDTPALLDPATTYTSAEKSEWNTICNSLCALIAKQHNALLPIEGLSRDLKLMLADHLQASSFAVDELVFFTLFHSHGGDKNGRSANLDTLLSYVVYAASQLFIEREETKLALCRQDLRGVQPCNLIGANAEKRAKDKFSFTQSEISRST